MTDLMSLNIFHLMGLEYISASIYIHGSQSKKRPLSNKYNCTVLYLECIHEDHIFLPLADGPKLK